MAGLTSASRVDPWARWGRPTSAHNYLYFHEYRGYTDLSLLFS